VAVVEHPTRLLDRTDRTPARDLWEDGLIRSYRHHQVVTAD